MDEPRRFVGWIAAIPLLGVAIGACHPTTSVGALATADASRQDPFVRRTFAPQIDGQAVVAGVSYGPFRDGQRPGGAVPSREEILEDLRLIAPRWQMIRMYSSAAPSEQVLRVIRDEHLPIRVMLGAWIAGTAATENAAEVDGAIRLANAYPDVVASVCIGNESQVAWSGHRAPPEPLIAYLRRARAAVRQPVTTADDYNFWNKPESHAIAAEVDFMVLHAYAMWNQQSLADAVPWTAKTIAAIRAEHPGLPLVFGETGWATELDPEGDERKYIKAPAGEAEQATFYREFTAWASDARVPYFYFEAFDERWKGSDNPHEVEKHWGLFGVDRKPKRALTE